MISTKEAAATTAAAIPVKDRAEKLQEATAKTIEALKKLSLPAGVDIKIKASTR